MPFITYLTQLLLLQQTLNCLKKENQTKKPQTNPQTQMQNSETLILLNNLEDPNSMQHKLIR